MHNALIHSKKCFQCIDSSEDFIIKPAPTPILKALLFSSFVLFIGAFFAFFIKSQPQAYNRYFFLPLIFTITAAISHLKQVISIYRHEQKLGTILLYDKKNDTISLPREKMSFNKSQINLELSTTFKSHGPETSLILLHKDKKIVIWTTLKGKDFYDEIMAALA